LRKIILDSDVGHDDVVAWSLIQASPELELLGVTTVFGNTSLERVWRNAHFTRKVLGSNVPILLGASEPLLRDRINAEAAHGPSGLAGVTMPEETAISQPRTAVQFIIDTVLEAPNQITLVPIGPLTNIALAMRLEPRIIPAIRQINLMGGSLTHGNFTPAAEFNILADPHAAQIVFSSGATIAMFGLNLTEETFLMPQDLERIKTWRTRAGAFLSDLLTHSLESHAGWGYPGASMHDPCPIIHLIRPELFTMRQMAVGIETQPGENFARTTGDPQGRWGRPANVNFAIDADRRELIEFLIGRLERLP
jgi:purine nucleosidase